MPRRLVLVVLELDLHVDSVIADVEFARDLAGERHGRNHLADQRSLLALVIENRLGLLWTYGVLENRIDVHKFVDLFATQPAKIFGLYPRKGALSVGSDADIVLLDPGRAGPIRKENMHETDYTPWEGWDAAVWPSMTIQRGKVPVENGKLLADLADGQFLPRKIDDEIRSRPAL